METGDIILHPNNAFCTVLTSHFWLGLKTRAPSCHVLEQTTHLNKKHMVWISKCHWDDRSWFLSVAYDTLNRGKKSQRIPCQSSGKWNLLESSLCLQRPRERGDFIERLCFLRSLLLHSKQARQPSGQELGGGGRAHPVIRFHINYNSCCQPLRSSPGLGPSQGKSTYTPLNNACIEYLSN